MELRNNLGNGLVALLALVQGGLRTCFGLASAGGLGVAARDQVMSMIDTPVSNETMVIAAPFLLLGALGLASAIGLIAHRPWGVYGTVAVSLATIAYDMWATLAIQPSAVMGFVVPVICIAHLAMKRNADPRSRAVRA
jgi:hypothetical protein